MKVNHRRKSRKTHRAESKWVSAKVFRTIAHQRKRSQVKANLYQDLPFFEKFDSDINEGRY